MFFDVSTLAVAVVCVIAGFVLGYYATKKKAVVKGLKP